MYTLEQTIERLYAAFADVPRPSHIDSCPCCFEEENIEVLLSTPLRELSAKDLHAYATSAFLTAGAVEDYLYFLPRILEVSFSEGFWCVDYPITGRAIAASEPHSWPRFRRSALLWFLHRLVGDIVDSGSHWTIDGVLCAIARMEFDVQPFLRQVEKSPAAVLAYFEDNVERLPQNKLRSAFWELPNSGHDAIVRWFKSEPIRQIPLNAYGYIM
jgi:hypothetical protein